jgi:mandelate racemase
MPDHAANPGLTIRSVRARPVEVPLNFVLGTSQGALRQVPLVLADLETEEGVTGRSWLFGYLPAAARAIVPLVEEIGQLTRGQTIDPAAIWAKLNRRFTLIGVQGVVRMAMAGFDTAAWDALAIVAGQPLARLLGASPKPVPAYNSCGLGLMDDTSALAAEAEALLAGGKFNAVKLRLGYSTLEQDIAAVQAVRKRIGDRPLLMVDYNQALTLPEALERGRALDEENIYWLEEPIRHDDYAGAARLTRELKIPVQLGENFSLPAGMAAALEQNCADYVMPDLERIGGVSGWCEAARLAAARRLPMSSHLFPEVSAHLLCATPTCHFLEYVDWANVLLQQPLTIIDGHAVISERPGNGMVWNEEAVERFRLH